MQIRGNFESDFKCIQYWASHHVCLFLSYTTHWSQHHRARGKYLHLAFLWRRITPSSWSSSSVTSGGWLKIHKSTSDSPLLIIIIIIIRSHWPSLTTHLYYPQLPGGLQDYILYLAGHPTFVHPCEGVHRSMLLISWSLLLQQCPACLVRLTWIVFIIDVRCPYSCCFVGCCLQDLFNIAHSILL